MMIEVNIKIDIDNLPPEIFDTYCYRRALIGEIKSRLYGPETYVPTVYRNTRKDIETWWSGNINIPGNTYSLSSVLNDIYHLMLGKDTICVFFDGGPEHEPTYNLEQAYTSKELVSEEDLLYTLRKTWNKMRSHRNKGYGLMWCIDGNLYRIRLLDPETYKKEKMDNTWRKIE